jgi:hypothetical protein
MLPSQSTGTENRGFVISLKTGPFFSAGGSVGRWSSMVAVDCMCVLLAHWTFSGVWVMVVPGQSVGTKWPVAAVSGLAVVCCLCVSSANWVFFVAGWCCLSRLVCLVVAVVSFVAREEGLLGVRAKSFVIFVT